MSRAFVKDDDQEEVPLVIPRAFLPKGAINYVTNEGMTALIEEKAALINERDSLTGNEEDTRVTRNYLNATIKLLDERISTAVVVQANQQPKGIIAFGSYVTITTTAHGEKEKGTSNHVTSKEETGNLSFQTIRITGADEANSNNYISYFSPLAKVLSGHKTGDTFKISLPSGEQTVTIVDISTSEPENFSTNKKKPLTIKQIKTGPKVDKLSGSTATISSYSSKEKTTDIHKISRIEPNKVTDNLLPLRKPGTFQGSMTEILPIVNDRGTTIGRATRGQCHDGNKLLHPVIRAYLFNSRGELLLQLQPSTSKWDTPLYCHMRFGEKPEQTLMRGASEQLSIECLSPTFIKCYKYESVNEKELVHIFKVTHDEPIEFNEEICLVKFWPISEIRETIGKKILTAMLEKEIKTLFNNIL